jgi:dipeptidyl aminopeptidase/acylaminoacyl peptidase
MTRGIAWNRDGQEIAFASTSSPVLTPDHVWTVPVNGEKAIDRTTDLIGSAVTVVGDPHGHVWVEVHRGVTSEVDEYRDGRLETRYQWPAGVIEGPPVSCAFSSGSKVLAFTVGDPTHSDNVAINRVTQLEKLTHEGDELLAAVKLGDVKVVHWVAKNGTRLEGIATFPAEFNTSKGHPFLVFPHGGPEDNDLVNFDDTVRLIAGTGYVVLQPQYRGSTGYGTEFMSSIYQHFGDRIFSDVDSATDFAIAQGWADPQHLAIFGWSGGGYVTAWTVTQTSRYRAAIEGAGVTDWLSFIPISDTWQTDYDARLQETDLAALLRFSPVMYADRVTTPLLILHGEADRRVPVVQGRELFALLAERGKSVRMVTYPGAPHNPKTAEQRRDVIHEIMTWLDRYNR